MKFLIVVLLFCSVSFSQTKQEFETRIDKNVLPNQIKTFINQLPDNTKRLRFYKETDGKKESFETKFKLEGNHYSCEFNTKEKLEDIEKLIKKKYITEAALNAMETYLDSSFKKHKFLKIQEQYVASSSDNPSVFFNKIIAKKIKITGYEIIIEITTDRSRTLKEFLFNSNGQYLNKRDIATSSYAHVLY